MEDYRVTQTGDEIQEIFNQSPVDSADIAELKEATTSLDGRLEAVEGKIPSGASSENPLTDKQYVDSSIASASATFRGTYNEVTDLELTTEATHAEIGEALASVIDTADSNDYCFVQIPTADATPTEIKSIERYKFVTGTGWQYEYTLNNSGFTADQWAAINSGITSGLVAKLTDLPTNAELNTLLNGKANAADVYTKSETYTKTELDTQLGAKVNSADVYPKTDTYTKQEVDALITTPEVQYVTVTATSGTTSVTDVLPATGAANTIYRVGSWDGTQYDDGVYSEYSWNGSAYILLDVKNYGLATGSDFDNPTTAQRELVTTVGSVLDGMPEGVFDVSARNSGSTWASLSALLSDADLDTLIPASWRKGGMSIKFVCSSDNKYVQYLYHGTSTAVADFTNTANWEKMNLEEEVSRLEHKIDGSVVEHFTRGGSINSGGTVTENDTYCYSEYIPVSPGTAYKIDYGYPADTQNVVEYNSGKSKVDYWPLYALYAPIKEFTTTANTAYIRFSFLPSYNAKVYQGDTLIWQAQSITSGLEDRVEDLEGEVSGIGSDLQTLSGELDSVKDDMSKIAVDKNKIDYGLLAGYIARGISGASITITDTSTGIHLSKSENINATYRFELTHAPKSILRIKYKSDKNLPDSINIYIDGTSVAVESIPANTKEYEFTYNFENGSGTISVGYTMYYNISSVDLDIQCFDANASGLKVMADNISDRVKELEDNQDSSNVLDYVTAPSVIYGSKYKADGFNLLNRLYVEGVLNKATDRIITLNDCQSIYAEEDNPSTVGDKTITVRVGGSKFDDASLTVPIKRVNPGLLVGKNIRIMHVGDSLTDDGVGSCSDFILKCFKADYGSFTHVFVGTKKSGTGSSGHIKLGNYEYDCPVCDEGTSGWSIADYLRKVFHVYIPGKSVETKIAWDAMGLATKTRNGVPGRETRVDLSVNAYATLEQMIELRQNCHGYYDADPSAELWDWIVNTLHITSFTFDGITYTFGASYSSSDDAAQKAAIKYICSDAYDHPAKNVFYDYNTVQSSNGEYAFNFSAYLSKYKTLANDGVTRLVVGETAGSKVVNVNAYDVCTPTHVCIVMSQNEYVASTYIVDDLIKFGDLVTDYDSNIKVIIGVNRPYGFMNPDYYDSLGCYKQFTFKGLQYSCNQLLKTEIVNTPYKMIDLYAIQNPSGTYVKTAFDLFDLGERVVDNSDSVHAGTAVIGYMERAYQFMCCIISQLNN